MATTALDRPAVPRTPIASIWLTAALAYITGRMAVLGAAVAAARMHGHTALLDVLTSWDGVWYERMADGGYPHDILGPDGRAVESTAVFFPGYGMVGRAADRVLPGGPALALVLVSMVAGFVATVLVGVLLSRRCSPDATRRGIILFSLFPGSFVFGFAYAEGLAIACAAACLLLLDDRRWLAAAVAAAAAVLSRSPGIAIVVAASVVALVELRRRQRGALVVPIAALAAYAGHHLFLWHHTGVVNAWFRVEHEGWGQRVGIYEGLLRPLKAAITVSDLSYVQLAGWGVIAGAVGVALLLKDRAPIALWSYAVAILTLSVSGSLISARPRALLTAFPLVLPLATRVRGRSFVAVASAFVAGLAVVSYHYGIGYLPGSRGPRSMVP